MRRYDESGPSPWAQKKLEQIKENVYVDVRGGVNVLGKDEPAVRAYNVKRVAVPEEIFAHHIHVAEELVRRICPQSQEKENRTTTPATTEMPLAATVDRGGTSPQLSRFAQPPYEPALPSSLGTKAQVPQQQTFSAQNSPFSFYDPKMSYQGSSGFHENNELSNGILMLLKNLATVKPHGLTGDEILMSLLGRGISKSDFCVAAKPDLVQ